MFHPADIDECSIPIHSCHINASCSNTDGSYDCQCLLGFDGDGFICTSKKSHFVILNFTNVIMLFTLSFADIDECVMSNLNNCSMYANCTDTIGSYECTCSEGFTGDGFTCHGRLENPSNNFALILNFTQTLTSALILIASPVILMPPATILLVALRAPV